MKNLPRNGIEYSGDEFKEKECVWRRDKLAEWAITYLRAGGGHILFKGFATKAGRRRQKKETKGQKKEKQVEETHIR